MVSKSPGRPRKVWPPKSEKTYTVCKNCPRKFIKEHKEHRFCCGNCRKEFHRYGGVNYRKLKEDLLTELRQIVREELRILAAAGNLK